MSETSEVMSMDTTVSSSCDGRDSSSSLSSLPSPIELCEAVSTTKISAGTNFLPPCRLCGAVASGFHYGANTCEACKAFFRRCTSKDFIPKPCSKMNACTEVVRGRLVCVACRFDKCLQVGMTKAASKKGRYTHERRTQYTNEIKGEEIKKEPMKYLPVVEPTPAELLLCKETLTEINKHSELCFPEMNAYMRVQKDVEERMDQMLADYGSNEIPDKPIYSPGKGEQQVFKDFCESLSKAAEQHKVAVNSEAPSPTPKAVNVLWHHWMLIAEMLFIELTKFAKQLPGFNDLLIDDRIILLKAARIEVSTLMAHPACRPEKHLIGMYHAVTDELILTPITLFPQGGFSNKFNDEHNTVMARLKKAQYTIEDINVIISFIVLSPDREGLLKPDRVELLQESMLKVLEHTLRKNHPQNPKILAETLLILPEIREHSEQMRRLLYEGKEETNPDLTPLINEVL